KAKVLNDAGKRAAAGTAAAAVILAVAGAAVLGAPVAAAPPPEPRPAGLAWKPSPAKDPAAGTRLKGLQCASLRVPLDHADPAAGQITLELTRSPHTAPRSKGVVLLNRGGPGAHGRDLPAFFTVSVPKPVA